MAGSLHSIYIAENPQQAHMLKNELEKRGIQAFVDNESLQIAGGDLPFGSMTAPRVLVNRDDADEAREIALAFDSSRRLTVEAAARGGANRQPPVTLGAMFYLVACVGLYLAIDRFTQDTEWNSTARAVFLNLAGIVGLALLYVAKRRGLILVEAHEDDDEEDEHEEDHQWPQCPSCGKRRHTSCPVCETAGTDFLPAYLPAGEIGLDDLNKSSAELLVLCPICDEPFTPEFPARCEWCGHRFRDGREAPIASSHYTSPFADFNMRALAVLVGLALLVGGLLAVFADIANR